MNVDVEEERKKTITIHDIHGHVYTAFNENIGPNALLLSTNGTNGEKEAIMA